MDLSWGCFVTVCKEHILPAAIHQALLLKALHYHLWVTWSPLCHRRGTSHLLGWPKRVTRPLAGMGPQLRVDLVVSLILGVDWQGWAVGAFQRKGSLACALSLAGSVKCGESHYVWPLRREANKWDRETICVLLWQASLVVWMKDWVKGHLDSASSQVVTQANHLTPLVCPKPSTEKAPAY